MNLLFKALNDPTRRAILEMLREKDLSAGEIAGRFNMSWPSISHHLDLLKKADLVVAQKEGQFVFYSINTTVMDDVFSGDDPDESNQHWCDAEAVHDAPRDLAGGGHPSHLGAVHPGDLDDVGAGPGVRAGHRCGRRPGGAAGPDAGARLAAAGGQLRRLRAADGSGRGPGSSAWWWSCRRRRHGVQACTGRR